MPSSQTPHAPLAAAPTPRGPVILILGLGVLLRCLQFFAQTDFWYDELAVVRNVVDRDLLALLSEPLDHHQMAPIGFLAMLGASTGVLGENGLGFRLPAFLMSVLALPLFWRVVTRFASGLPLLAVLIMFAVSPALVWYGGSTKPYMGDVTISMLLVLLGLRYLERPDDRRRARVAAVVGGLAMPCSYPAVPTAAVLVVALWIWHRRHRSAFPPAPLRIMGCGWAVGMAFAAWAALALRDGQTAGFMQGFWTGGFPPESDSLGTLVWVLSSVFRGFAHFQFHFGPEHPVIFVLTLVPFVLALVGAVWLGRIHRAELALLLAPLLAGMAAAFVYLLPYSQRLAVHAGWPFLVLTAFALCRARKRFTGKARTLPPILAGCISLPILLMVIGVHRPPYEAGPSHLRPTLVLRDFVAERQPGDAIYVFTAGRHDMAYYGRSLGVQAWQQGERHDAEPRGYLREVDALRGQQRAWVFWSQRGMKPRAGLPLIQAYLAHIGRELQRVPPGATPMIGAVLYDLSDPQRLQRATAEDFPLAASTQK